MSSQDQTAWKDWEEYQLGLQGTATGSAYNQMGLSDKTKSSSKWRNPPRPQKKSKVGAKKTTQGTRKNDELGFSWWVAIIAFIAAFFFFNEPKGDSLLSTIIISGIVGLLAGKLYKVILIAVTIGGIAFALGYK